METNNHTLLRESLTPDILQKSTLSPNFATDLEDLSDFLDYLTQELYTFLPPPLQTATPLSTSTPPTPTALQPLIPHDRMIDQIYEYSHSYYNKNKRSLPYRPPNVSQ